VKPPVGTVSEGSSDSTPIKALGFGVDKNGTCFDFGLINHGNFEECTDPKQIDDLQKKKLLELQLLMNPNDITIKAQLGFIDTRLLAGAACANNATGDKSKARAECTANVSRMQQSKFYEDLSPAQRLHFWQLTQGGLRSGHLGRDEIQQMTRVSERCRVSSGAMTCNSPGYLEEVASQRPRATLTVLVLPVLAVLGVVAIFAIAANATKIAIDGKPFALPPMPQLRLQLPWLSGIPVNVPGQGSVTVPWNSVGDALTSIVNSNPLRPLSQTEQDEYDAFVKRCQAVGAVENPNRPGSWGRIGPDGRFEEKVRIDFPQQGVPRGSWRDKLHGHQDGGKEHEPDLSKLGC
jgi:hypothetical protein